MSRWRECDGCGREVNEDVGEQPGTIWCDTPLGLAALHVHRTQACGKAALAARPDWKMRKGNQPPMSKAEREARALADAA